MLALFLAQLLTPYVSTAIWAPNPPDVGISQAGGATGAGWGHRAKAEPGLQGRES